MRKYATAATLRDMGKDAKDLEAAVTSPPTTPVPPAAIDRARKKLRTIKGRIDDMTPPPLEGAEKDAAKRRADLLRSRIFAESGPAPAPSQHEMRLNPFGAVDKHLRHERFWNTHNLDESGNPVKVDPKNSYGAFNELQDTMLRLANTDGEFIENPNASNLERFRPVGRKPGLMDANPWIPEGRTYALSQKAKENFDGIFPDRTPTAMEAKLAEFEKLQEAKLKDLLEENERLRREKENLKSELEEAKPAPSLKCAALTKAGKPCPTHPIKNSRYCMVHRRMYEE